jgi:4-diphosphocytidyl-2-C-methyl-D-erythritol kinase
VNLTLEVLGRRDDGYHEVRSLAQTLALHDTLDLERSDKWDITMAGEAESIADNLIACAGTVVESITRRTLPTRIRCLKRIPIAAGLGGGSSNAAATLVGLSRLWRLRLRRQHLQSIGAQIGSDVPFLVQGGTAQMSGRGTEVAPVSALPTHWVVLAIPTFRVADKTSTMYAHLRPGHFTRGEHTARLRQALNEGKPPQREPLFNVFEAVADSVFPGLERVRDTLEHASGLEFHLAGAGPALFALTTSREMADLGLRAIQRLDLRGILTRTRQAGPGARSAAGPHPGSGRCPPYTG